jgi:gem associated protein 8
MFLVNLDANFITSDAPRERVGLKREEELKDLYGDRASIIHLAETSLQMKFDKNLDTYQPSFWPSFPLRIKFN